MLTAAPAVAQHEGHMMGAVYPPWGSGTSWLPAVAPMRGFHFQASAWSVMVHGSVFGQFIQEYGPRGNYQLGSINWVMGDASRPLAGGTFHGRMMASAEYFTVTRAGYPQLLQVAQPYRGGTLTDRMHPHELFSEVAVMYDRSIAGTWRWSVYLAPVGEPSLGPVAYLHRPSAVNNPTAPLGHHSQDVTHESFGVATVGVFTPRVHLEASVFNGAHPNEVRTNFDYRGARFNSYSARVTVNPTEHWSIAGSVAYIDPREHQPLHRLELSALHVARAWSTSFVWGANVPTDTRRVLNTALVEANVDLDPRNAVFGRAEYVTRTSDELALVGSVSEEVPVGALALGYARRLREIRGVGAWLGARGDVSFVPEQLRLFYGSRTPLGFIVYLQLRPGPMMEPMSH
ncbi:MAG TPA: hypothetical protein VNJ06_07095 [Gemmatimonadales bacterium]|nr:hypothetical protein [Gemmatimonadales bacterium]